MMVYATASCDAHAGRRVSNPPPAPQAVLHQEHADTALLKLADRAVSEQVRRHITTDQHYGCR